MAELQRTEPDTAITIDSAELRYFIERAVRGMSAIVTSLGDELAALRPDLPGANTPYGLLTHCLGVMEYWGGHVIAGREVVRDRSAEFVATGPVAELAASAGAALDRLAEDLARVNAAAAPRNQPGAEFVGPERPLTQAGVILHIYEELAQHHGQLEVLRDALVAPVSATVELDPPLDWLRGKRSVKWHRPGPDLIPAWVADMDFPVAPVVAQAIASAVDRGDLGYPDWRGHPLAGAFVGRMSARYGWAPAPGHVRGVTDLIQALQIVLRLISEPGDGVVAFTPNYPPFLATIASMDRRLLAVPFEPGTPRGWGWRPDALEQAVAAPNARVLLLVNPHNPTGTVYAQDELARIAELARRHDLVVVSDEIHAELTYAPWRHRPFAAVSEDAAARTVTVTSASKAFNLAGLRTAVAHVGPDELRRRWDAEPRDLFGATNVLGVEATLAAWTLGDPWLDAVRAHLQGQRDHLVTRIAEIPGLTLRPPQATYLAWLDGTGLGLGVPVAQWAREQAGVELSSGPDFGPGNEHFARLNFATSRAVLDQIVDRLEWAASRPRG